MCRRPRCSRTRPRVVVVAAEAVRAPCSARRATRSWRAARGCSLARARSRCPRLTRPAATAACSRSCSRRRAPSSTASSRASSTPPSATTRPLPSLPHTLRLRLRLRPQRSAHTSAGKARGPLRRSRVSPTPSSPSLCATTASSCSTSCASPSSTAPSTPPPTRPWLRPSSCRLLFVKGTPFFSLAWAFSLLRVWTGKERASLWDQAAGRVCVVLP